MCSVFVVFNYVDSCASPCLKLKLGWGFTEHTHILVWLSFNLNVLVGTVLILIDV